MDKIDYTNKIEVAKLLFNSQHYEKCYEYLSDVELESTDQEQQKDLNLMIIVSKIMTGKSTDIVKDSETLDFYTRANVLSRFNVEVPEELKEIVSYYKEHSRDILFDDYNIDTISNAKLSLNEQEYIKENLFTQLENAIKTNSYKTRTIMFYIENMSLSDYDRERLNYYKLYYAYYNDNIEVARSAIKQIHDAFKDKRLLEKFDIKGSLMDFITYFGRRNLVTIDDYNMIKDIFKNTVYEAFLFAEYVHMFDIPKHNIMLEFKELKSRLSMVDNDEILKVEQLLSRIP